MRRHNPPLSNGQRFRLSGELMARMKRAVFIRRTAKTGELQPYEMSDLIRDALNAHLAHIEKDSAGMSRWNATTEGKSLAVLLAKD